ncbi:MAG: ribosome biogenesis GTPase Der, partial [Candidatus Competibacterales bacterium]|nr:ribosome biogenesis GTPase Der [Candidatus Competibacterales bacterium]
AHDAAGRSLSTPELTRILEQAVNRHPPPLVQGQRIKLRYAHQGGHHPPRIVIHGSRTARVPAAYRRYLINTFRATLELTGTPLALEFRSGDNPYANRPSRRQSPRRPASGRRRR